MPLPHYIMTDKSEPVATSAASMDNHLPHGSICLYKSIRYNMKVLLKKEALLHCIQQEQPDLLAIYAFGSQMNGTANNNSDLDLAVLVEGYADPLQLWHLSSNLANIAGCPVDLVDLRRASTVMQYQIITTGQRWWQKDVQAALYETAILSEKTELDTARAPLLKDIYQSGRIYG